ncbi:hypothetical protein GF342_02255 [Candidatus Woesearchaeota archaeon]|nr:hypothetical protein [Candidatus Woesearchaeota archaeon]
MTSPLQKVFVVDKSAPRAEFCATWLEATLPERTGLRADIHCASSLRDIAEEVGRTRHEAIVLGNTHRIRTRRLRRLQNGDHERPPLERVLRGFCVASLLTGGPSYDGRLSGRKETLASELLDIYHARRPRVLIVDREPLEQTYASLEPFHLNCMVMNEPAGSEVFRKGRYHSFDVIFVSPDFDATTLRWISNEGAAPIYLYADTPPSSQYGLSEEGDRVRERLAFDLGHCENVRGIVCPRTDWYTVSALSYEIVDQGPTKIDDPLSIDLSRSVHPTTRIRDPERGGLSKEVYATRCTK